MLEYSMLYPVNSLSRRMQTMDGMWKFQVDKEGIGEKENWFCGIPGEEMIPVPASFQDFYTEEEIRDFAGDVWYEKDFFVPKEWEEKEISLRFGAATHTATVYVNGTEITKHIGGFLPFGAMLHEVVHYDSYNKVVVKVNNELSITNIPCGKTEILSDGRKINKSYFDFFNYSGLQRSVYLVALPKESIFDIDLDYSIDGTDADVRYRIVTTGDNSVELYLYDQEGKRVAFSKGKDGDLHVNDAHLWEVRKAYLYRLVIQIKKGDSIVDEYAQDIGIRTVKVENEQILINGKAVYLKGFGKHEDSDIVGRGFNIGVMKRDFELMKWISANSFRTAHYPYSEEIYQMADREGFLVIDEVPAVGLFESIHNFLDATTDKKSGFFDKDTTPELLSNHLQAVEEMVTRDKNHPCVVIWSLFNEPETTGEAAVPYFERIFSKASELDFQKRPRTFAMMINSKVDTCKCYQFSDIISLNRYYGWYIKGGNEIDDAENLFRKEMDSWKALELNKPFIFLEYGAEALAAEHKLPSVMWSQEYQEEYLNMTHGVFDSYHFVKGEQIWNFADFQTSEGIMRVNGNNKGIFTRQRQPKSAAYSLKRRWENLPLEYKK